MVRETGKQRSQRIQIDYYRKPSGLDRWRTGCVVTALLVAGLYAFYVVAAGGRSHTSTGPLASVHASFEQDCDTCHKALTPMDPHAVKMDWNLVGLDARKSIEHIESTCQQCHSVGDHHRDRMVETSKTLDQNCAQCHADHQGRDHALASVADHKCVDCHANLDQVCIALATVRSNVSAFTLETHGDFASLQEGDRGRVKFDHHQHMLPGQVHEGQRGPFTIGMLDDVLRQRYRKPGQDDTSPVSLDCSSCHELAGDPLPASDIAEDITVSAAREFGSFIAPVSFQRHCSACHALNPGLASEETTPLPHAVEWKKIDLLLAATARGAAATGITRPPRDDRQSTPQPGAGLGNPPPAFSYSIEDSLQDAETRRNQVVSQCLKCHDQESISDAAIRSALVGSAIPLIPQRWLRFGRYDHGAHRDVDCRYCHQAAYPTDGQDRAAVDHQSVMIAGIESCTGCHRDAESPTPDAIRVGTAKALLGRQPTWASDRCTLCHRYHTARPTPAESLP